MLASANSQALLGIAQYSTSEVAPERAPRV